MSENDLKNRSVSSDQCMSGTSVFNNCIREYSKFNRNKIKGLSKKFVQRSRHALFYASIQGHAVDCIANSCHLRHRDRQPSRIQVKWLTRKFRKSRAFRKYLRGCLCKTRLVILKLKINHVPYFCHSLGLLSIP